MIPLETPGLARCACGVPGKPDDGAQYEVDTAAPCFRWGWFCEHFGRARYCDSCSREWWSPANDDDTCDGGIIKEECAECRASE